MFDFGLGIEEVWRMRNEENVFLILTLKVWDTLRLSQCHSDPPRRIRRPQKVAPQVISLVLYIMRVSSTNPARFLSDSRND